MIIKNIFLVYSSVENDDSYDYPFNPNDHQNSINISSKKNNSEKAKGISFFFFF